MLCGSIRCSWQDPSVALKVTNNQQINKRQTGVIVKLSHLKWEDGGEVMTLRRDIPPHS